MTWPPRARFLCSTQLPLLDTHEFPKRIRTAEVVLASGPILSPGDVVGARPQTKNPFRTGL